MDALEKKKNHHKKVIELMARSLKENGYFLISGNKIEITEDGFYRPNALTINGETATMSAHSKEHGYNWRSTASGNVLYYLTESGKSYEVRQGTLMDIEKKLKEV